MPYIKVNGNELRNYSTELSSIKSKVSQIKSDFSSLSSVLDWDVKAQSSISQRINRIANELTNEGCSLSKMSSFLQTSAQKYGEEDSSIHILSNQLGATSEAITENEIALVIEDLAEVTGIPSDQINEGLESGQFNLSDVLEAINSWVGGTDKAISATNGFVKLVTGFGKLKIKVSNGIVILSNFKRNGTLNKIVQFFSKDGTGLGTKYRADTFKNTIPGKLQSFGKIAETIGNIANVVEAGVGAVTGALDAAGKINNIWADDSKSLNDKKCETFAVGITSARGIALDVAAPFVGTAVAGVVSTFATPIVGAVVGAAVSDFMHFTSDIITSEEVVGAVSAGTKAISAAGQKLAESQNFGEAVSNTLNLAGETFKAGVEVVSTVVNTAVNKAVEGVKNFFKKW